MRIRTLEGVALAFVSSIWIAACGGSSSSSGVKMLTHLGKGEGVLNVIAWEGYTQPQWVKPFTQQTGCQVNAKYAGSSDEMVTLMRQSGGSQYDLVSASGDASLRLIRGGDVAPVNVNLVPGWKDFIPQLQSPSHNTVNGVHYGISLQWGPNLLMYNPQVIKTAPTSWSVIYNPKYKGQITVPDNPIQIADAALYLSKHNPSLGISDPYELTQNQLNAAVALLKQQRPLIVKYWGLASDEVDLFKNGNATVGAAWPFQVSTLQADHSPVAQLIPSEGATGWADTWMLASHAKHPNCAYMWMRYISTPKVQAEQAVSYGETPANRLACPYMNQIQKGSCAQYHANAPTSYFDSIKFWKTPTTTCDNGQSDCTSYTEWQQKWTGIKG